MMLATFEQICCGRRSGTALENCHKVGGYPEENMGAGMQCRKVLPERTCNSKTPKLLLSLARLEGVEMH